MIIFYQNFLTKCFLKLWVIYQYLVVTRLKKGCKDIVITPQIRIFHFSLWIAYTFWNIDSVNLNYLILHTFFMEKLVPTGELFKYTHLLDPVIELSFKEFIRPFFYALRIVNFLYKITIC